MRVPVRQNDGTYHVTVTNAHNANNANSATEANRLKNGVLTYGYTAPSSRNDGTQSSGTYRPAPHPYAPNNGGNWRKITNNGSFTFDAPQQPGSYSMTIDITNGNNAGAITFTGFVSGYPRGPLTTASGDRFKLHIDRSDAGVTGYIEAL